MAYDIKKHEVDRVMNVLVMLGWVKIDERIDEKGVTLTIRRELSDELLLAAGELDKISSPQ